jgi:hypothetical protein
MALAAETRAGAVASFDRMMPTRTLIAVLVWLRARERIWVSDLAICYVMPRLAPAREEYIFVLIPIAIRPVNETDIGYAVMLASLLA